MCSNQPHTNTHPNPTIGLLFYLWNCKTKSIGLVAATTNLDQLQYWLHVCRIYQFGFRCCVAVLLIRIIRIRLIKTPTLIRWTDVAGENEMVMNRKAETMLHSNTNVLQPLTTRQNRCQNTQCTECTKRECRGCDSFIHSERSERDSWRMCESEQLHAKRLFIMYRCYPSTQRNTSGVRIYMLLQSNGKATHNGRDDEARLRKLKSQ